jgi:uncharacterized protein (DUF2236 family)
MKKIENNFFDLIALIISFLASMFRSFFTLIWSKKKIKKTYFFKSLDFIFILWPKYFWNDPSALKIFNYFSYFIDYVFYNKKINNENK